MNDKTAKDEMPTDEAQDAQDAGVEYAPKTVTLTVGDKRGEVEYGTRLVLAIERLGIEIGHRCGGKGRCTTCRVRFLSGEPDVMTEAEYRKLKEKGLLGEVRLSCQIICDHDMALEVLMTRQSEGWPDTGPTPAPTVEPEARWYPKDELMRRE